MWRSFEMTPNCAMNFEDLGAYQNFTIFVDERSDLWCQSCNLWSGFKFHAHSLRNVFFRSRHDVLKNC